MKSGEYGFIQGLFGMMYALFSGDSESYPYSKSVQASENQRKSELSKFRLCISLSSYLYFLVTQKTVRLQISDSPTDYQAAAGQQQPTLTLLSSFLNFVTTSLERAADKNPYFLTRFKT